MFIFYICVAFTSIISFIVAFILYLCKVLFNLLISVFTDSTFTCVCFLKVTYNLTLLLSFGLTSKIARFNVRFLTFLNSKICKLVAYSTANIRQSDKLVKTSEKTDCIYCFRNKIESQYFVPADWQLLLGKTRLHKYTNN